MAIQIRNLRELLQGSLGTDRVIGCTTLTRLTPPGENFGSIMLKFDITLRNKKNDSEKIIHAVAKILPDTEKFRKIFHIQTTYTNEMAFYEIVVPTLQNFQLELGITKVIESFPKCIATRKNLTGGDKIDDDAVLVLENLIEKGYKNIDRVEGFDLETAKMVLRDMAELHAVPLALKITKPDLFQQKIKAYCNDYDPTYIKGYENLVRDIVRQNNEIAHLAPQITYWGQIKRSKPREPFATMVHADIWTNNTMQKFEEGRPISNKFVDFQLLTYGSPAADVFFFIWSSLPQEVLEPHLEHLFVYYHEHFIYQLKKHNIDVTPFSYETFLKELHMESEYEIGHASMFYVNSVGRPQDDDFKDFDSQVVLDKTTQRTKEKIWYMVKECLRRGWLI